MPKATLLVNPEVLAARLWLPEGTTIVGARMGEPGEPLVHRVIGLEVDHADIPPTESGYVVAEFRDHYGDDGLRATRFVRWVGS